MTDTVAYGHETNDIHNIFTLSRVNHLHALSLAAGPAEQTTHACSLPHLDRPSSAFAEDLLPPQIIDDHVAAQQDPAPAEPEHLRLVREDHGAEGTRIVKEATDKDDAVGCWFFAGALGAGAGGSGRGVC